MRPGGPRRTIVAATAVNMLVMVPVFLVGGLAVFIRSDLGFTQVQLGGAVSLFFAVSAVSSTPGGGIGERVGAYRAMVVGTLLSALSLVGIAAFGRTYGVLLAWLCLAAMANAVAQPAVNLSLARGVDPRQRGVAFGIKEASIPLATLTAGLGVPTIALTVGWRWAFAGAAAAAVALAVLVVRPDAGQHRLQRDRVGIDTPLIALILLTVGASCGSMAAISMGTFYVESAVARGLDPAAAGWWFAGGSGSGVVARVFWGWLTDRRGAGFGLVSWLLAAGATGFALLATGVSPMALGVGSVLAFAAGWGWMGVFNYAVVLHNLRAPAAATGITTAGVFAGGVMGPVAFGAILERTSFATAWLAAAASLVAAAVLVQAGQALVIASARTRPRTSPVRAASRDCRD